MCLRGDNQDLTTEGYRGSVHERNARNSFLGQGVGGADGTAEVGDTMDVNRTAQTDV